MVRKIFSLSVNLSRIVKYTSIAGIFVVLLFSSLEISAQNQNNPVPVIPDTIKIQISQQQHDIDIRQNKETEDMVNNKKKKIIFQADQSDENSIPADGNNKKSAIQYPEKEAILPNHKND